MINATIERPQTIEKPLIAELSVSQIKRLTRAELVNIIHVVHPAFLTDDMLRRIEDRDRAELERMVYLCRRCCRQQGF